jgi:hypothetical protein
MNSLLRGINHLNVKSESCPIDIPKPLSSILKIRGEHGSGGNEIQDEIERQ